MKRDGFWFWIGVVVLVALVYTGAQYVRGETVCAKGYAKTWEWVPPHWECRT